MKQIKEKTILGVGLIGIGRKWGYKETSIPTEEQALIYLKTAYDLGITFFDTAPAYGASETRVGKFLQSISQPQRKKITIATKFGEHWNSSKSEPYTDHSYEALIQSINQSIVRLGKIDILQVHKTTPIVLNSDAIKKAIVYAKSRGITHFGASVSDIESAQIVCDNPLFTSIQFPYNEENQTFISFIRKAIAKGKTVIINRPFNMGATLYQNWEKLTKEQQRIHAYQFILEKLLFNGVILTGTKAITHLEDNIKAFKTAQLLTE